MIIRHTISELEGLVGYLNKVLPGKDYEISVAYGQPRLTSNNGSKDVSPRLPTGQLYHWIHAFLSGIEEGKLHGL